MSLMGCVGSAAAVNCVFCVPCHNASIICCCRGNAHICSSMQSPALHRCCWVHVCTGERRCLCSAAERQLCSVTNDKRSREKKNMPQLSSSNEAGSFSTETLGGRTDVICLKSTTSCSSKVLMRQASLSSSFVCSFRENKS